MAVGVRGATATCLDAATLNQGLTLPVQDPFQRLRLFLDGVSAHGLQALGEELGIGAVQGRDERLQAPLLPRQCYSTPPPIAHQLAPMIENVDLVLQRHSSGVETGNRRDDVARSHITPGIVIEADDQYTGMRSVRRLNHFV